MPRQHEPPAGGAAPAAAVRRAVAVPPPGEDPGAELRPRGPGPAPAPDSAADPDAAVPAPASAERRSRAAGEEGRRQERQQRRAAEAGGAEAEAASGAVAAGDGDGGRAAANADADGTAPGRLRGPMVAAAALVGAVLICVPLLVLALNREDERTVETAPVGGTTLDPGTSDDVPAVDYRADSPSPSASPSGSPSPSGAPAAPKAESEPSPSGSERADAGEKAASRAVAGKEKDDGEAAPKAEKPPAITARQLANALSTRVNAQLKNVATGKCADLPYFDKGSVDGPVSQYDCRPTTQDNQLWDLEVADADGGPRGASLFVIRNRKDGMCMDLPDYGGVAPGTKVTEYHCRPAADNQLWWLEPQSGAHRIRNAASDLCMSVVGGGSAGNDARLQVARCGSGTGEQRWSVVSVVKPS
ncbi:RICIN domain-containing protein [Streptomyces sp. XY152]|uniref:RICIN domain-containing protein n=1 Tax=Streptomyces sp. XY152 TaxID=1415560 RepID=UPI0006AE3DC8|nr:RICIN domain-containing protein [Streptomyces sp. XY152]